MYLLGLEKKLKVLFIVMLAIASWPLFVTDTLPLYDYPSHIARIAILSDNGLNEFLRKYYEVNWHFVPNLSIDLFAIIPIISSFEADTIGRIYIFVSFFLITTGVIRVHRCLGLSGVWPFVSFFFLWNEILIYGFVSYIFTIGLALWLFSFWLKRPNQSFPILILFSVGTFFLLANHLYGFAIYALMVGGFELSKFIEKVKLCRVSAFASLGYGALQFLPALIIFALFSETSSGVSIIEPAGLIQKIAAISSIILLYNRYVSLIIVSVLICSFCYLLIVQRLKIVRHYHWIIIICLVVFVLAPSAMFKSHFVTHRLPLACVLIMLPGLYFTSGGKQLKAYFPLLICIMFFVQTTFITYKWRVFDQIYNDLFFVVEKVEDGKSVIPLYNPPDRWSERISPPLIRTLEYLIPEKKIFVPSILAHDWHQTIRLTALSKSLLPYDNSLEECSWSENINQKSPVSCYSSDVINRYDYLLMGRFSLDGISIPETWRLVKNRGVFSLYENIAGIDSSVVQE